MASFVSITVGLNQAPPDNALWKLALDLIAYTPREEIVYFRTCSNFEAEEDLHVLLPNLKALDLYRAPLSAVFPTLDPDGYRALQIFPPSLQFLCLRRPHLNAYNWTPLITFLSHRASSGNKLDTLLIDGPCHMCSPVSWKIRGMVREFKIDRECLVHGVPWVAAFRRSDDRYDEASFVVDQFLSLALQRHSRQMCCIPKPDLLRS